MLGGRGGAGSRTLGTNGAGGAPTSGAFGAPFDVSASFGLAPFAAGVGVSALAAGAGLAVRAEADGVAGSTVGDALAAAGSVTGDVRPGPSPDGRRFMGGLRALSPAGGAGGDFGGAGASAAFGAGAPAAFGGAGSAAFAAGAGGEGSSARAAAGGACIHFAGHRGAADRAVRAGTVLDQDLRALSGKPGAGLIVRHGLASSEIVALASTLGVQAVFAARDYEPQARARDAAAVRKPASWSSGTFAR